MVPRDSTLDVRQQLLVPHHHFLVIVLKINLQLVGSHI